MRPLTRFIIVFAIALLSDALLIFGGASFGRLNVPETTAGASDYGVWVGLPVIAGIVMAAWWWHRTRNFSLGLWSVFALPISAGIALFFEAGTHDRWYIQNEGLARWLSVAVWYVSYILLMGGALILWVKSAKALLHEGRCVVCRQSMPAAATNCPSCGAERATDPAERHDHTAPA